MRQQGSRVTEGGRPITVNGKVPPRRLANAVARAGRREYLTPEEVERELAEPHEVIAFAAGSCSVFTEVRPWLDCQRLFPKGAPTNS
jgi:hypothetical protein